MLTLFQTAELFVFRAAWYADAGKKDVVPMTLCAKVFCTENAEQVGQLGPADFIRCRLQRRQCG